MPEAKLLPDLKVGFHKQVLKYSSKPKANEI